MNSDILGILTRAKGGSFATFTFTSYLVILSMHSVNRLRRLPLKKQCMRVFEMLTKGRDATARK